MTIDPDTYYRNIHATIHIVSNIISHDVDIKKYSGRSGSREFEEKEVKSYIRKNHDLILGRVNKDLSDDLRLDHINASENSGESSERTMEDISLVFSSSDDEEDSVIVPVNIKCVSGKNSDNIGGWSALNFCLYGDNLQTKKKKVLERIIQEKYSYSCGDYFLWVFHKDKESSLIIKESSLFSLLGTDISAISINSSQSFPLQFASHRVKEEYCSIEDSLYLYQRRVDLTQKIATTMYEKYGKEEKLWRQILNKDAAVKNSAKDISLDHEKYASRLSRDLASLSSQEEKEEILGKDSYQELRKSLLPTLNIATVKISPD